MQPPRLLPTGKRTEPAQDCTSCPRIIKFLGYDPVKSNATTLGEKIKQYRIQKGLSLRNLAMELGIDPGTLARWEGGQKIPSMKMPERLEGLDLM